MGKLCLSLIRGTNTSCDELPTDRAVWLAFPVPGPQPRGAVGSHRQRPVVLRARPAPSGPIPGPAAPVVASKVQYLLRPGQQDVHNVPGREKAPALQAAGDNLVSSMGSWLLILFLVFLQGFEAQLAL